MTILATILFACSLLLCPKATQHSTAKAKQSFSVIAYYSGNASDLDRYAIDRLTHIIYSFVHLRGNRLYVSPAAGNILQKLVSLKKKHPSLKIQVALGGWGGCKTCSEVFSTAEGRNEFAASVAEALEKHQVDGIDLDWEYPAVQGPIGHRFVPEDKQHFTELIKALRSELGADKEISFAAGGFPEFLEQSIEWKKVAPLTDRINLMTYDLVNRWSTHTGHHTGLYSTGEQLRSADYAIRFLDSMNIPRNKLVMGAASYARVYENVGSRNNGLYQPGKFKQFVVYKSYDRVFTAANGYKCYWDDEAKAPYCYNAARKLFATFDNIRSVQLKTQYAIDKNLNGIMFWELRQDEPGKGLLNAIYTTLEGNAVKVKVLPSEHLPAGRQVEH